ncbi:MAG: Holliday junction branch migration protein RuvA [Proteobacteria bacterium]|nr:Holliday junction branch migration protein RuvA [Pseudomonadota bacterium]
MISYLKGTVVCRDTESVVVDVQGVGYGVFLTTQGLALSPPHAETERIFWIHTHTNQDQLKLFGFLSYQERVYFSLLLGLTSVGPKLALAVLSALNPKDIYNCAQSKDYTTLQSVPGIGRKKAERIVLELSTKIEKLPTLLAYSTPNSATLPLATNIISPDSQNIPSSEDHPQGKIIRDVRSALKNLSYSQSEIDQALHNSFKQDNHPEDINFDTLFKQCIDYLHQFSRLK